MIIIYIFAVYSHIILTSLAIKVFYEGDIIEWAVDLGISRESDGVFCSRIEAYLQKDADAFNNPEDLSPNQPNSNNMVEIMKNYKDTFSSDPIVGDLIGFTERKHPFFKEAFPIRVEVGRRYKVKWEIRIPRDNIKMLNDNFHVTTAHYRLSLVCVWPDYNIASSFIDNPEAWKALKRRWIAVSEPFAISRKFVIDKKIPIASVFDISPPSYYGDENNLVCPISFFRPERPIRTDSNQMYDFKSLMEYMQRKRESQSQYNNICPIGNKPIKCIWDDEALRAKLMKFSETFINEVNSADGWCFADAEANRGNLATDRINRHLSVNPLGSKLILSNAGETREDDLRAQIKDLTYKLRRETFTLWINERTVVIGVIFALLAYFLVVLVQVAIQNRNVGLYYGLIVPFLVMFTALEAFAIAEIRTTTRTRLNDINELKRKRESLMLILRVMDDYLSSENNFEHFKSLYGYPWESGESVHHVVDILPSSDELQIHNNPIPQPLYIENQ